MSDSTLPEDNLTEEELIDAVVEEAERLAAEMLAKKEALYTDIASRIDRKLTERMGLRKGKEAQWIESMRLYLGSLSHFDTPSSDWPMGLSDSERNKREGGKRPEYNIVRNKCELAMAQTITNQFASGDKNWALKAPPVCDLDEEDIRTALEAFLQQQEQMTQQGPPQEGAEGQPPAPPPLPTLEELMLFKVDLMEKEIENHLIATKYGMEVRKAMMDRVILGTGVIKGPKNVGVRKKVYKKLTTSDGRTVRVPTFIEEKVPRLYRVNPWCFFPDDSATDAIQAEDSIEIHPMTKGELRELLQHSGFLPDQIIKCLEEDPKDYPNSPFNDPAFLTQGNNTTKNKYMVLEYHGPLDKEDLELFGIESYTDDPSDEVYGEVWCVNGRVIRIDVSDIEGAYRIPYKMCVWEPDPASPFGYGIPMLVRDQQRVVNETYKMILDNAGVSAGPQVVVDTTLIKPADGGMQCTPWKVWYSTEFGADVTKAIQFFIPDNAFEGLAALLGLAQKFADDESSIQSLVGGGMASPQAGESATGLMIMNQNATAPLFFKAEEWDDAITYPIIQDMYDWEMQYNPKEEIKGAYEIDVRTSTSYMRSQIEQQKLERLRQEIAQGSPIGEWVNMDELAVASLAGMKLPYKGIVKSSQQVMQDRANRPPPPPDPALIRAQAQMMRVEVDKERLELDKQVEQVKANKELTEAQMKYQAQLRTDQVRMQEAQAIALKAQLDYQRSLIELAARSENDRARILADLEKSMASTNVDRMVAAMNAEGKARDQSLKQQELNLKRQGKSGITSIP